jgi:general nucleoside transport system permease protein
MCGGVQALQLRLQAFGWQLSPYVLMMAPYVFTLLALLLASRYALGRRLGTPTALGIPYEREES